MFLLLLAQKDWEKHSSLRSWLRNTLAATKMCIISEKHERLPL